MHPYCAVRFVLVVICGMIWHVLSSQKFHVGAGLSVLAAQVDGDNLRGFNFIGYSGSIFSGYAIGDASSLVVELGYSTSGSRQRKEQQALRLEVELHTLDAMLAYAVRFGDAWDGQRRFRLIAGPRLHAIQSATLGTSVNRDPLHRFYISAHVGIGYFITHHLLVTFSYTHAVSNLLQTEVMGIDRLAPYAAGVGVVYVIGGRGK